MRKKLNLWMYPVALVIVCGQTAPAFSSGMDLVSIIMESLAVTKDQATGGPGAIFSSAKSKLPAEDFSKVEAAVPNMDEFL